MNDKPNISEVDFQELFFKSLKTINFPNFNIVNDISRQELEEVISDRLYWLVFNHPANDSRRILLMYLSARIIDRIENEVLFPVKLKSFYIGSGLCKNCDSDSKDIKYLLCDNCRKFAELGLLNSRYATHYKVSEGNVFYTNYFNEDIREKESLLNLRFLIQELDYIPSENDLNYNASPGRSVLYRKAIWQYIMQSDLTLIKFLSQTNSGDWYKAKFGSWFQTLVKAEILKNGQRRTMFGTTCIANDGHLCNSIAEKSIDDWLYKNEIQHEKETFYPFHQHLNPNKKLRTDWIVKDCYIEYFGLQGILEYDRKIQIKRELLASQNIILIELYDSDIKNLDFKLSQIK